MDENRPLFDAMGKKIFHCGDIGAGLIVKICNNMALGIQMMSIAEALNLGEKLGLDAKLLAEVMGVSTSSCWSLTVHTPAPGVNENAPSSKGYEGGFSVGLIAKDMSIAV